MVCTLINGIIVKKGELFFEISRVQSYFTSESEGEKEHIYIFKTQILQIYI